MPVVVDESHGEIVEQGPQRVNLVLPVEVLLDDLELYDELVLVDEHEALARDKLKRLSLPAHLKLLGILCVDVQHQRPVLLNQESVIDRLAINE